MSGHTPAQRRARSPPRGGTRHVDDPRLFGRVLGLEPRLFIRACVGTVLLAFCAAGYKSQRSGAVTPAPSGTQVGVAQTDIASTRAQMTTSQLRVRPFSAGYGGVGPATPAPYPDLWIVLFVDLESSANLRGVEVAEVALLDAGGNAVAWAKPPWNVRRDLGEAARGEMDFAEQGTVPFHGEAEPGRPLRLRIHAPLDTRAASLKSKPVRFRVWIRAASDPGAAVEGRLQEPWCTG